MSRKNKTADETERLAFPNPGNEVVISGISGRFPESDNLTQLQENLFNKVDLITDDDRRWKLDHPDIPQRTGKINNIEKFDAKFFEVDFKEAYKMDPAARILLELACEAIVDAGVNPRKLRGTNTGVFIGTCYSETESKWLYESDQADGLGIPGCSRAMMSNRISNWLGTKGPSYTIDAACSSSLFALDHAFRAIRNGECDDALVGGCNLCLHPRMSLQYSRLGALSSEGRCRSFDADGSGYCRSEAISMIYLQKIKDAKRFYAQVVYTKTNCDGFKEEGITFPSGEMQCALLKQFYEDCRISPSSLAFLEAHGTGTKAGDPVEVNSIAQVFCPGRTTPLRIGAIKSNLGHSEPASGLCAIAKVIVAMESGYIPPNLHYNRPREEIEALKDGRIQVITEPTPWEGGYVGVNSFGFGGANAHVLLKSNPKEKLNNGAPNDDIPRLVVVSGRTKNAVTTLLDNLESRPVDAEYVSLLHNIHAKEIVGHVYRGYTILPPRGIRKNNVQDVQYYSATKRPVWFVFSGIGFQWAGMGQSLLKIPVFNKAIQKCNVALKPFHVDIFDIFTKNKDPKTFDDILNSFLGTTAVQIGLVDVLAAIEIEPDNIIGHSIGELACAYTDGCLTLEQTILVAYFQGLFLIESETIPEFFASVELGYEEWQGMCPSATEIAFPNDLECSTISGPANVMNRFVAELQGNDIVTRQKPDSKIACRRSHTTMDVSKLSIYLQKVIPDPKSRSQKWLSISVPREEWDSDELCSPEYCAKNLFTPVSFEETCRLIPNNATAIEIAPNCSLRAIFEKSLNKNVENIALTNRDGGDSVEVLLQAIGKMFEVGLSPKLTSLYPDVQYPVSRGTPMISPLVRWEHSHDWYVMSVQQQHKTNSGERVVCLNLLDDDFEWMAGHVIDGRNLVPATGYLTLIWESVGMMLGKLYTEVSVVFENVKFHRATTIPKEGSVQLTIMIQKGSGRFEVTEGSATVVTGFVRAVPKPTQERVSTDTLSDHDDELALSHKDIYKELCLRGYNYAGMFRGLKGASLKGTKGRIAWEKNWAVFMDNMLQMNLLKTDTRGLFVVMGIRRLVIDTKLHSHQLRTMPDDVKEFTIHIHQDLDVIVSGGVEIKGLTVSAIGRKKPHGDPVLEEFKFVAHRDGAEMGLGVAIRVATQIAIENHFGSKIKSIELIDEGDHISPENLTSILILEFLNDLPMIQADVNIIGPAEKFANHALPSTLKILKPNQLVTACDALIVISHGLLASKDSKILKEVMKVVKSGSFLLAREPLNTTTDVYSTLRSLDFDILMEKRTNEEFIFLLCRRKKISEIAAVIRMYNNEFTWVSTLQDLLKIESEKKASIRSRILLVSEGDFESGLMGLVNCLRKEQGGQMIQGLFLQDLQAPKFTLEEPFYSEQLKLGSALNVLRPGKLWGSYRFFAMDPITSHPVYHARISQLTRGDLSAIKWVEGAMKPSLHNENVIRIHYSSINFRDVMLGVGKLAVEVAAKTRQAQESVIGFEYSGRDVNGHPVMGMIPSGALSNLCVCDRDLLWSVPEDWTLEDAATIPAVYGTACYALFLRGKIKKEDRVLIHAGSGGVGQAAIRLALREGCEVFTTVGTPQKREFIRKHFPQIDDDHIGNSRDTSFEQLVLRMTRGRGVDMVLNSLAEDKLQASVRCLATEGRFLEIGKFDLVADNTLGMGAFLKGISFHAVLMDNIFTAPRDEKIALANILTEGIKSGAVEPLVRTVFSMDQIETAFRYMAAGKHIGKVLIKIRGENDVRESPLPLALPRYYCSEESSYLILGGLGGFGLELADWLVLRGAKKLVLTSRTGISNGYQQMRIDIWKSYGVEVVIVVDEDAFTHDGCEAILKKTIALGPVDAIFNLAVVLNDALYENQTVESFEESFRVKAWATKQFDELSRILCPHLKQFVVFSSVSCGRGNVGQTNYGMANSAMERICERRVAENLPGLAIQWGSIADVGVVAKMLEVQKEVSFGGILQQKISSCLQELERFLQQNSPVVSSMIVAEKVATRSEVTSIVNAVVNIMGLKDLKTVSLHIPLSELGMDSMMAVEIKQTLEREFEVFLTAADIRGLSFLKLQEMSSMPVEEICKESVQDVTNKTEDSNDMQMLVRIVGHNQTNNDVCVPLTTKADNGRKEVFILPGIEGWHTAFQPLVSKLKSLTTCLQLGRTFTNSTSIEEMADYLIPYVKAKSKDHDDFAIVGYSFGTLLAIEIARRLESEDLSGRLVLIDGSPDHLKTLIKQQFIRDSEDQLQSNLLFWLMDIVEPIACKELTVNLENCDTWEEKLAAFTKSLPDGTRLNLALDDQRAMCSSIYHRVKAVLNYDSSAFSPLRTPITLIRSRIQSVRSMPEDYGLRSVTTKNVEIHYAEGNHITMLEDDICAAAINGELDEHVTRYHAA